MVIAVDFDGTIIEGGNFPSLGPSLPYAFEVLNFIKSKGHKLILWTCRGGESLDIAVKFCRDNGLEFDAINENINPEQYVHTSNKIVANIYIDDAAYPVIKRELFEGKPAIDWLEIGKDFGFNP